MGMHDPGSMRLRLGASQALVTCPTGANHWERDKPCQDACMVAQHYYRGTPYAVMAVADGHGSDKYIRSDIGAHFAVEAAGDAASDLVIGLTSMRESYPDDWERLIQHEVSHRLGRTLVRRWRDRVDQHVTDHSDVGKEGESEAWREQYGSTVALVVVYDDRWLITASLGDSGIFVARREQQSEEYRIGEVAARSDERVGLGTDSLVSARANYLWRFEIIPTEHEPPAMVLLTTDGLIDSLERPHDSIRDLCAKTVRHGVDWLEEVLPQQLARWSDEGVGDDMGCIAWFPSLTWTSPDSNEEGDRSLPNTAAHVPDRAEGYDSYQIDENKPDATAAGTSGAIRDQEIEGDHDGANH